MPYVALITGASSGIGEATARRLAREPDTELILVARRGERLQKLARELGGAGAYSASKFALAGWSDALYAEELAHGVHVGLVLPGFVRTEGFPAAELMARPHTRLIVTEPEAVAEAILAAGPGGVPERYTPRFYWLAAAARVLIPGVVRRATAGGAFTTATTAKE